MGGANSQLGSDTSHQLCSAWVTEHKGAPLRLFYIQNNHYAERWWIQRRSKSGNITEQAGMKLGSDN